MMITSLHTTCTDAVITGHACLPGLWWTRLLLAKEANFYSFSQSSIKSITNTYNFLLFASWFLLFSQHHKSHSCFVPCIAGCQIPVAPGIPYSSFSILTHILLCSTNPNHTLRHQSQSRFNLNLAQSNNRPQLKYIYLTYNRQGYDSITTACTRPCSDFTYANHWYLASHFLPIKLLRKDFFV